MSSICEKLNEGDIEQQRKAADACHMMTPLTTNILKFLNASPTTLFECPPQDPEEQVQFYEDNFEACITCTVAMDETLRDGARELCERLMLDKNVMLVLRKALSRVDSKNFLNKFWKLRYARYNHACVVFIS